MENLASTTKRVSISSKRQITIPLKFYTDLGFGKEAVCVVENGKLVLSPAENESGGEFAEQILTDLIEEGYSGKKLLAEFKRRQSKIRPAVEKMLQQAKDAAMDKTEYSSYEDIFGAKDEE